MNTQLEQDISHTVAIIITSGFDFVTSSLTVIFDLL